MWVWLVLLVASVALLAQYFLADTEQGSVTTMLMYGRKGQFLKYKNMDLFFIFAKQSEQSVTFLHGFPTSSFDYAHYFDALQQDKYSIVALDFLGFGLSDKPRPYNYSLVEQADIVQLLWQHLNISRTHIMCHDYAVSVVQELLARNCSTIASVTFLNGGLFPSLHRPILVQTVLANHYVGPYLSQLLNFALFKNSLSKVFGVAPSDELLLQYWAFLKHKNGNKLAYYLLQYMQERRDYADRWERALHETRVPLQFVNGPADSVSGIHLAQELKRRNFEVHVLAANIGHYPQVEDAETVLQLFRAFLHKQKE